MEGLTGMELHKAIKQMRRDRGLTQARLADAVGVSTFTLIRWERGERTPDTRLFRNVEPHANTFESAQTRRMSQRISTMDATTSTSVP